MGSIAAFLGGFENLPLVSKAVRRNLNSTECNTELYKVLLSWSDQFEKCGVSKECIKQAIRPTISYRMSSLAARMIIKPRSPLDKKNLALRTIYNTLIKRNRGYIKEILPNKNIELNEIREVLHQIQAAKDQILWDFCVHSTPVWSGMNELVNSLEGKELHERAEGIRVWINNQTYSFHYQLKTAVYRINSSEKPPFPYNEPCLLNIPFEEECSFL
jgi:hypothetical protein